MTLNHLTALHIPYLPRKKSLSNTNLNNYIKKRYSDVLEPALGKDELTSHSLRSAYYAMAFYLFGDWSQTLESLDEDLSQFSQASYQ